MLGREPDGSLDSEVLVLGTVDKVGGDYRALTVGSQISLPRFTLFACPPNCAYSHFSRFLTLLLVKVILILWTLAPPVAPVFSKSSLLAILLT